ncbi:hypothetical protein EYF80_055100 [Liparis tanakae]|uniref:Uncharacterized protein n=1 Tax=Liparis tanakae TaxID=230148 RepID=A0A4Z2F1B0_9TELE|nr:hypothetical protein EYF80_055100 [Liparis tanakae]
MCTGASGQRAARGPAPRPCSSPVDVSSVRAKLLPLPAARRVYHRVNHHVRALRRMSGSGTISLLAMQARKKRTKPRKPGKK